MFLHPFTHLCDMVIVGMWILEICPTMCFGGHSDLSMLINSSVVDFSADLRKLPLVLLISQFRRIVQTCRRITLKHDDITSYHGRRAFSIIIGWQVWIYLGDQTWMLQVFVCSVFENMACGRFLKSLLWEITLLLKIKQQSSIEHEIIYGISKKKNIMLLNTNIHKRISTIIVVVLINIYIILQLCNATTGIEIKVQRLFNFTLFTQNRLSFPPERRQHLVVPSWTNQQSVPSPLFQNRHAT